MPRSQLRQPSETEPERDRDTETASDTRHDNRDVSTESSGDQICPECDGSLVVDHDRGERVCSSCGLVAEADQIDRGPEWRAFDAEEREEKSRVGSPTTPLLHDEGLSTEIGWADQDAYGNAIDPDKRAQLSRMRTWNQRAKTRDSKERDFRKALSEIERMGSALGLPEPIREIASVLYRRALDEGLLPGRSIEGVASAAIYAASRQADAPRSLDEVAPVSRVDRLEIARTYRYVKRELDLEISPVDPVEYLPRFASDLDVSTVVERRARDLLKMAKDRGLHSGKSPTGMAAAAIYAAGLVVDQRVTQDEVSAVSDVSQVTIRNRYMELVEAAPDVEVD